MKRTAASLGILIAVASAAGAGTFTVSNTNDSGAGSLRAAITAANGAAGPHTINFSVSGTISPTSALPALTEATTIAPATIGDVTLLGTSAGAGVDGLTLAAPGCVVQKLIVRGFSGNGIVASSGSNTIGGAGTLRNVVSANGASGILVNGSSNQVTGNRIGTDSSGSADDGNTLNGVTIQGGSGNTVDGNLVAGNNGAGIALLGASNNVLDGNVIGLDLAVTNAVPNSSHGIYLQGASSNNQLCGATPSTIAGNGGDGVAILAGSGNRIRGCKIYLNGGPAIDLDRDGALPLDGVTFDDPGDVDSGANGLLNAPVLRSTTTTSVTGKLRGLPSSQQTVDVYTSASCNKVGYGEGAILLASTTVTTDGNGVASFSLGPWTAVSSTSAYTATATDNAGNTSEFSQCATAGRRPVETLATFVPVPDVPFQPPKAGLTGTLYGPSQGDHLPPASVWIYNPGLTLPSDQTASYVMGDWNGDGFETVGIYASGGAFFYTNDAGPTSNWQGVWFGFVGKPVVAGRLDGTVDHDCVGVIDNADNWLGSGDT
ncbi:MAG TPA: right-handed parallel beta-helix repeat-containing protein, partial [Thermoanaerobaculia bacterium]|nr:right-handed parallel beta-helix repeat-containing protein [Thermoanaerobaculia bacterium]